MKNKHQTLAQCKEEQLDRVIFDISAIVRDNWNDSDVKMSRARKVLGEAFDTVATAARKNPALKTCCPDMRVVTCRSCGYNHGKKKRKEYEK